MPQPARVAIDLGAESCRVSLLRFIDGQPSVAVLHRIPNGPVRHGDSLHWPLHSILAGLEDGLRKAAQAAPEGIASISVESWSVDHVRLAPDGSPLREPFCYRDERTVRSQGNRRRHLAPTTFSSAPAQFRCASTPSISFWPIPQPESIRTLRGPCFPEYVLLLAKRPPRRRVHECQS